MRDELAGELLEELLGWSEDEREARLPRLLAMSRWKWDGYEGFTAGQRLMESLVRWLQGFESTTERMRWLDFLLDQVIFISAAELEHAISLVYDDYVRPSVIRRVSARLDIPSYRTTAISATPQYRADQRRPLVLGLSDGARLDLLRRSSTGLSHEQFSLTADLGFRQVETLVSKLNSALSSWLLDEPRTFSSVLLVDDFYGSGTSLINIEDADGQKRIGGKVGKFLDSVRGQGLDSPGAEGEPQLLETGYRGTILLYVASAQAADYIRRTLATAGLDWELWVVQRIPHSSVVTDEKLLADCEKFWDSVLEDAHKANSARGYKDCALPLVLYHNTPNNSVSPLWADSTGRGGRDMHALFPRYERHHVDRP
mgnify:CR=1 FL=1